MAEGVNLEKKTAKMAVTEELLLTPSAYPLMLFIQKKHACIFMAEKEEKELGGDGEK